MVQHWQGGLLWASWRPVLLSGVSSRRPPGGLLSALWVILGRVVAADLLRLVPGAVVGSLLCLVGLLGLLVALPVVDVGR